MIKIFQILTMLILFCTASFAAKSVMHNDGKVVIPNFAEKNELVPTTNLSVFIDTYRDGMDDVGGNYYYNYGVHASYWSDCELKVLDENGNIIYFFSTIKFNNQQVEALHDKKYNDTNAIVYYYVSGTGVNACVKPKKLFPKDKWDSSIGKTENAYNGTSYVGDGKVRITGIQIYPSAKFREVFLNPKNSIMIWRQSVNAAELDGNGGKLWRPAIIQFIR
jgi:hypothetical protein